MKSLHFLTFALVGCYVLADDYPPVKVELYFESYCPFSQDYFLDQLYPTWQELGSIMDIYLYPFGNAQYYQSSDGNGWDFKCQHGPNECKTNMIIVCAENQFHNINFTMEYVNCLLSANKPVQAGEMCANEIGQPWEPIDQCANSIEGQDLLHSVGVLQESVTPPVTYVPWIILNDVHNQLEQSACQSSMKTVVCNEYTGPKPSNCAVSVSHFWETKS